MRELSSFLTLDFNDFIIIAIAMAAVSGIYGLYLMYGYMKSHRIKSLSRTIVTCIIFISATLTIIIYMFPQPLYKSIYDISALRIYPYNSPIMTIGNTQKNEYNVMIKNYEGLEEILSRYKCRRKIAAENMYGYSDRDINIMVYDKRAEDVVHFNITEKFCKRYKIGESSFYVINSDKLVEEIQEFMAQQDNFEIIDSEDR